jgi:SAM-dependent methyltransferase
VTDYLERNRTAWTGFAAEYVESGRRNWEGEAEWGIWGIPEHEVRMLPDVDGMDTIELGCGTAYVSAWLARRGARPVGIDPTPAQLATARMLQDEFDLHFPLVETRAEELPFPNESFDFAISEYGAATWADPYAWIPEAARVMRPGAELVLLGNSTLISLCVHDDESVPAGPTLLRPQFGMHRYEWDDDPPTVEFHLSHGDWIRLFRTSGFEILDLIELRPPEGATTRYPWVTAEWARQWPSEEVWRVRKHG